MAKQIDISFELEGDKKFNYRVGAVVKNKDKYLLCKTDGDNFMWLLGGRMALGQNSSEALVREFEEETGVTLKEGDYKLIRVCENFFTHKGKDFHEILFIYLVEKEELNKMDNFRTLDKPDTINKWVTKKELENIEVRPHAFKNWIEDTSTLKHEVIR